MKLYTTAQVERASRARFWAGFTAGVVFGISLGFAIGAWL